MIAAVVAYMSSKSTFDLSLNQAAGYAPYVTSKKCRRAHHLWLGREWKFVEIRFDAVF